MGVKVPLGIPPPANGLTAGPPDPAQVAVCRVFLDRCAKTKTPRLSSYGLKHTIEQLGGILRVE